MAPWRIESREASVVIALLTLAAALAALLACGSVYQAVGAAHDRRRFPPLGELVEVDGRRLHVIASGSGRPAVIFESGISASCLNWTRLRQEVAQFTRACAYDRASLGWSDRA